jgi:hypothetical protein
MAAATPAAVLAGCTPDTPRSTARRDSDSRASDPGAGAGDRSSSEPSRELPTLSRPILRPWADDIVWLSAPAVTLPAAYVSVARREVYVDSAFRDRASWLLRAHISVSTALWRIPLAGDPPRRPIPPGDEEREFEERPISAWDPSVPPGVDDIRIVGGGAAIRRVEFSCVPLSGTVPAAAAQRWLSGGPFELVVSDGTMDDTVREDFGVVGVGLRYLDRRCSGSGDAVQYVSWASRQLAGASR